MLDDFFEDDEDSDKKNKAKSLMHLIGTGKPPEISKFEFIDPVIENRLKPPPIQEYFGIGLNTLKCLNKNDLHNLLRDDFEEIENDDLRKCILLVHKDMLLEKSTKDVIKEILSDMRAEKQKPKHWFFRGLQYLLATLFGTIIASYNPEIRQAFDWILQAIGF